MKHKKGITAASVGILLLLPVMLIYLTGNLYHTFASFSVAAAGSMNPVTLPDDNQAETGPVTFLLYGVDSGEWVGGTYREGVGRADTIVLIQADPLTKKAALLSIPRDTLVEIPGRSGSDKINHAYAFGQVPLLIEAVERFTGVPVDFHMGLNYRAFKDIVDLLGGVEFEVDRVITCRGLRLEPGRQLLDGDEAFALVSFRNESMGDIARVQRQQRFIKAVAGSAGKSTLDQLFYIILAAWDNLDTDLSIPGMIELGRQFSGITEENMAMEIVPGWFYNRGGVSYWKPDLRETEAVIKKLFNSPPSGAEEG